MKKSYVLFFNIFLFQVILIAQSPDTLWTKIFGGISWDIGVTGQQTTDGGYIIVGYTRSIGAGNSDAWLIKTGAAGDTLWTRTFGGGDADNGISVQQTTDGGYIIVGLTRSIGAGNSDVWLIKTNSSGDTLWTKTFGGGDADGGYSVQQTTDGGYIIAGYTESIGAGNLDVWLIKTDDTGDTIWTKTFGGSDMDYAEAVQQTTDGGYIITGYTESFAVGSNDVWLIKTDIAGDTLWTKTFGGGDADGGYSVQQTTDGGYIITGYTESFGVGNSDVWLIKTDAAGDTIWTKTFGGSDWENCFSGQQTTDGGYIVVGMTQTIGAGNSDVWLIKTNSSGDTLWTKTFGGGDADVGYSVQQTTDGGYIIVGFTRSIGAGNEDVWLIKTTPDVSDVKPQNNLKQADFSLCQNYPNPFNPITKISWQSPISGQQTIKVYDVLGNKVATLVNEYKPAGSYEVEFNAEGLPSGVYFYKIQTGDFVETKKMILMK